MRVLLAGQARERDRVRRALAGAGIDIVAERDAPPSSAEIPADVETVITVAPARARPVPMLQDYADDPLLEPLTAREREVLTLLAEGLSNRAIADVLGISDQTVKFHVAAILAKLGASNRTDAVRRAVRRGLVTL